MGIKEHTINEIPSNDLSSVKTTLVLENLRDFIKKLRKTCRKTI